jgi:hypothetical protein
MINATSYPNIGIGFELGYDKAPTVGTATWSSAANYND